MPKPIVAVVWARAKAHCEGCKKKILAGDGHIDHRPPLKLRQRIAGLKETDPDAYEPQANDPDYLQLLCPECHKTWTFGGKLHRGDLQNIAKSKRLERNEAERTKKVGEFTAAVLAKDPMKEQVVTRFKSKWTKGQAMPGSKASGFKKKMSGKVEKR
jgi:hypothetical protein